MVDEEMAVIPVRMAVVQITRYTDEMFVEHALTGVRHVFEDTGEIRPMVEVITTVDPKTMKKSNTHFSLMMQPEHFSSNDGSKDFMAHIVRRMVEEFDAVAYMFTSECWMIVRDNDDPMEVPSEAKDRKETAQVTIELKYPRKEMFYSAEIIRKGTKVELGPWDKIEGVAMVGRFSGVFKTKEDFS